MRTLLLFLLSLLSAAAQLVDVARLPFATAPYFRAGVPGGIPIYPVFTNVVTAGAAADGVTDDYAVIADCITKCTNGGAIYFPAGVYRINTTIQPAVTKQIVFRGAGPTQTRLLCYGASGAFLFGDDDTRTQQYVNSGYTRGSTTLVLSNATAIVTNEMCRFMQDDDPAVAFGSFADSQDHQAQMFKLLTVDGTTVTLDTPLYYSGYAAEFNPHLEQFHAAITRAGIEDLGLTYYGAYDNNIYFKNANECWVKNVASSNAVHANISLADCYHCEIRDNQLYYHQVYDNDSRTGVMLWEYSTACLVENNIIQGGSSAMTVQRQAAGNVVSYNYASWGFGANYPLSSGEANGIGAHGDLSNFNLFEGNIIPWLSFDEYWGCNRMNTGHRNWIRRSTEFNTVGGWTAVHTAIYVDSTNYFHNLIGNILGKPEHMGETQCVWSIGYARRANNDCPATPGDDWVATNIFIHGNFDWSDSSIGWSNGISHTLPNSYYLTAKPSWFSNLAWPPIGPDVSVCTNNAITNTMLIPAQARFNGLDYSVVTVTIGNLSIGTLTILGP